MQKYVPNSKLTRIQVCHVTQTVHCSCTESESIIQIKLPPATCCHNAATLINDFIYKLRMIEFAENIARYFSTEINKSYSLV